MSHRNVIGPRVKTQSLYLLSGTTGNKHWDFQTNVNSLMRCRADEVMRVSLSSVNIFNSYKQINPENNVISLFSLGIGGDVQGSVTVPIPVGTYTLTDLAALIQTALRSVIDTTRVTYDAATNGFTISFEPFTYNVDVKFTGTMNLILGFSDQTLSGGRVYRSDRVSLPHGVAEIVVELFGLTAIEGAAPVSNYESVSDDVDFGHVLAVVPAGPVWERTIFNNNSPEFNSFFFSEHSVNTLRILLADRQGHPHTWIAHPVGISLLFETFKRA